MLRSAVSADTAPTTPQPPGTPGLTRPGASMRKSMPLVTGGILRDGRGPRPVRCRPVAYNHRDGAFETYRIADGADDAAFAVQLVAFIVMAVILSAPCGGIDRKGLGEIAEPLDHKLLGLGADGTGQRASPGRCVSLEGHHHQAHLISQFLRGQRAKAKPCVLASRGTRGNGSRPDTGGSPLGSRGLPADRLKSFQPQVANDHGGDPDHDTHIE